MIRSFADKRTEDIFHGTRKNLFPPGVLQRARVKLDRLNAAKDIGDLRVPPGNHLERLSGDRKGQYSLRVSRGWRICFQWRNGSAYKVELTNHYNKN
ncbi:MAG: type II toxin-antitoxin system RelE/ParE family toxin [Gammaproteobacteria bacterium]|nr:type II toxin-antitoxin system RelE/ParE family toxin [Gammaproteobacteria bacterium]